MQVSAKWINIYCNRNLKPKSLFFRVDVYTACLFLIMEGKKVISESSRGGNTRFGDILPRIHPAPKEEEFCGVFVM